MPFCESVRGFRWFGSTAGRFRSARLEKRVASYFFQTRLIGRWEQGQGKPQFDYILKLADVLEVSLDRLLRGAEGGPPVQFDIRNKKLKELCRKVDQLRPADQEVICHFLDMAVRHERLKQIVVDPISAVR